MAAAAVQPGQRRLAARPGRPNLRIPNSEDVGRLLAATAGGPWHLPLALAATTGVRRGELLGLRWAAVDLEAGLVRIVASLQRIGGELVLVDPKTDRARRTIGLPPATVALLRRHRKEQAERRLLIGEAWQDQDLVIERGDGRPVDPGHLSHAFGRIAKGAGLEGVRPRPALRRPRGSG